MLNLIRKIRQYSVACFRRLQIASFNPHIRENKSQILYQYLPDIDFELFALMDRPDGLVVDVGANRGHCTLSVLSRTGHLNVYAFEPNPDMAKPLKYIKKRYPERFQFSICGLGAIPDAGILKIPVGGQTDVSTNASFRPSEFDKDYVQERLGEETGVPFDQLKLQSQQVEIKTLDSFDLEPLAIKIDVEGFELNVIEGARDTIIAYKPMLMIEMNNQHEFWPLLESFGYRFYRYDGAKNRLIEFPQNETYLNVVCLHDENRIFPADYFYNPSARPSSH